MSDLTNEVLSRLSSLELAMRRLQALDYTPLAANLPTHAMLLIAQFKVSSGNAYVYAGAGYGANLFGVYNYQNPPANGDAAQTTCMLRAGNYKLYVAGQTEPDAGMLDWSVNGSNVLTGQDWYSAGVGANTVQSANIVIAASGLQTFKYTVNGKNVASSNYFLVLYAAWVVPQ